MGSISSDALFHFTKSPKNLFGILENNFKPRFCLEEIQIKRKVNKVAFPMVCFCDIPLSQIKNHIETYGYYGIGMKKEWAERKKLNPILYLRKNSTFADRINNLFENVQDDSFKNGSDLHKETRSEVLSILRYIKTYEGDLPGKDKNLKNVRFYNEREWRYIPILKKKLLVMVESAFNDILERERYNKVAGEKVLEFVPNDIKYIFVKSENEILPMVEVLTKLKSGYTRGDVEILTSRIITSDQILNDF